MGRLTRGLKHMWNAFSYEESAAARASGALGPGQLGAMYGGASVPHQARVRVSNERSIISSIYTRIAADVGSAGYKHVRLDDTGKYMEDMKTSLNDCLTVEANIDQGPDTFLRDFALTLLDKGVAAVVPVEMTADPAATGSWDVGQLRVGEVTAWYPQKVKVRVYNDAPNKGIREEITIDKRFVAIVQNPFYTVMNEPNSTLQRLINKLNLLDAVDQQSASGKLDMIIQLPYVIKTDARRQQAEQRRKDIEFQLRGSQYGIAYADGTEKITQLNRPATNNLMDQIAYLQALLYEQLGITAEILNGTADEKTMLNYETRVVDQILDALKSEMIRKFLTKTARTQGQTIMYFKNPFKLLPFSQFAKVADALSRNEIMSPNELRTSIGMKPSLDPAANSLKNSNMPLGTTPGTATQQVDPNAPPPDPNAPPPADPNAPPPASGGNDVANAALDQVSHAIDSAFAEFGLSDGTNQNAPVG